MPTSTEIGIDAKAAHAAGLDYLRKDRRQPEKPSSSDPENKKPEATEKRKVKNQAEIDRVREANEKIDLENREIKRKRIEIQAAVEGALDMVSGKLSKGGLSEKEKARLSWISKSFKDARNKLKNGFDEPYKVEVLDDKNKVIASREETLPLDGLRRAVGDEIAKAKRVVKQAEQREALKNKAETNTLDEESKKREWRQILDKLPEGNLKKRILARAEEWKAIDEANGEKYDQSRMESQLGEACFQVFKETAQTEIDIAKKVGGEKSREAQRLQKVVDTMISGAEGYFVHHYNKLSSELDNKEKQQQDLYTKREANFISQDDSYRGMLLEDYQGSLPKDFDQMDKQRQDYELAMLVLNDRLVLKMPKFKQYLKVPEIVYEPEQPKTSEVPRDVKPVGITPEYKLQNTNQPYDIENPAFGPGKPADLKGKNVPEGPKAPELPKKLVLVDISEIARRMARAQAEERQQKEYKEMNRFKRAFKGITETTRVGKYYEEALAKIEKDNNLMAAISERLSGTHNKDSKIPVSPEYTKLLDGAVLEYEHNVADSQREVGEVVSNDPDVQNRLKELLINHSKNSWKSLGREYDNLQGREAVEFYVKKEIIPLLESKQWSKDPHRQSDKKGLLFASNFYNIAEAYKKHLEDEKTVAGGELNEKGKEALQKHLDGILNLELQLGYKERDLVNNRPEGVLARYEKLVQWTEGSGVKKVAGRILLNPFIAGAVTVGGSRIAQRALKWGVVAGGAALGAAGFWVPLAAGAAAGGIYRSFKRSKDVKHDQAQELRHQTLGGQASEVLGKNGELGYGAAIMDFKTAQATVDALHGKTDLSLAEKQQLSQIYARLELEREMFNSTDKKSAKVDLFKLDEADGKNYGSTASAKAQLRVALSKLGFSEQGLQNVTDVRGLISAERGKILDLIKETNKKQESFRRKEMLKAGVSGAVIGLAGGVLAQSAINYAGEQAEHLWGGNYFHNHGTQLGQIKDWYEGHLGHQSGGPNVDRFINISHDRTSAEFMRELRGHVDGGGAVEKIHTHNWFDNPDDTDPHVHNANELRFLISKDGSGNLHFKVPVNEDDSWSWNHDKTNLIPADITRAFTEGHMKMIFVPDGSGSGAHEGVVFNIDPATKELVVPPGSNIRGLFDNRGMFKGKGYFGLAIENGTRGDGSKNYDWVNSMRGNGQKMDYGHVSQRVRVPTVLTPDVAKYYDSETVPIVPPTRKIFLRPEEAKLEKERKEKAKKKSKIRKLPKALVAFSKPVIKSIFSKTEKGHGHDHHGGHGHGSESGGGGHTEKKEGEKKKETSEVKAPEFKGDVLNRYLNPKYAEALLKVYEGHGGNLAKIDKKAIKYAIEGEKHKGVLSIDRPSKKDSAKAVWEMEQALIAGKVLNQDQVDDAYEELKPVPKEEKKPETPKTDTKTEQKGKSDNEAKVESDLSGEDSEKSKQETGNKNYDLKEEQKKLEEDWGPNFHITASQSSGGRRNQSARALAGLSRALSRGQEGSVQRVLGKTFEGRSKKGLYIEFDLPGGKPRFENGKFILPADSNTQDIFKALETVGVKRKVKAVSRENDRGNRQNQNAERRAA